MAIVDLKPQLKISRLPDGVAPEKLSYDAWEQVLVLDAVQGNFPVQALSYTSAKQGGCRNLKMTLDRMVDIKYGDLLQLKARGEWVYGGIINNIPKQGTNTTYNYTAYGLADQLKWNLIEEFSVENMTLRAAVKKLHRDYIWPSTALQYGLSAPYFDIPSMIGDWDTIIENMVFEWKYPQEILEILRRMGERWSSG